jgi:Lactate racemase N-terminal domain
MEFPRLVTVRQTLHSDARADPAGRVDSGLEALGLPGELPSGSRVAVAVGSRNIDGLAVVVSRLIERLFEAGCSPFVVPAMGSHGGATASGQVAVLRSLGVDWQRLGAPIVSSMRAVLLGTTPGGVEAYIDRNALEADAIIVVNRVAPHTGYSGDVQSGVVKMLAVGLGKDVGAAALHKHGFASGHLIGEVADLVIEKTPVLAAVALVEDGTNKISRVEVLHRGDMRACEPGLLELARSMWPRIPVKSADVLIVDEIGKDISGTGMDPLVTGRGKNLPLGESHVFTTTCLVALSLTPGSGGNATGVGHADIISTRLFEGIDHEVTRRNVMTSGALERARIPLVAGSDREALRIALERVEGGAAATPGIVRIRNTRNLEEIQVSTTLLPEVMGVEGMTVGPERELAFDRDGNII